MNPTQTKSSAVNNVLLNNDLTNDVLPTTDTAPNILQYSQLKPIPKSIDVMVVMARAFWTKGDLDNAMIWLNKALAMTVKRADIWYDKANLLLLQDKTVEAVVCFDRGFQLDDPNINDLHKIGTLAKEQKQFDIAVRCFERVLSAYEDYPNIYYDLIYTTYWNRAYTRTVELCDIALNKTPDVVYFWFMRGYAYREQRLYPQAIESFEKAAQIDPYHPELLGILFGLKTKIGDWNHLTDLTEQMITSMDARYPIAAPFDFVAACDAPQQQLYCAESYVQRNGFIEKPLTTERFDFTEQIQSRIKVAYVSADFYNHATAILMAELFEIHNKERFEIYAYSYGENIEDEWRIRLRNAFEHFHEVSTWDDKSIAEHIQAQNISIVIDLKGYTTHSRTAIFSYRPAPIQINYIGFPGTMGASFIDYIIADNTLIPPHLERFYSEKIIRLPHTYQPNDRHRIIGDTVPSRAEVGLPESGFVYCCFNNPYKVMPETFSVWMRILQAVPDSVLWLLKDEPETEANLKRQASMAGVDASRLIFAERRSIPEHLARHILADLFLDTLPYNAHTTTSDALWTGLPVLTCMGQSFASRVAASLLNACGLTELITESRADYEKLAIELACHPTKLATIRAKLIANRDKHPLFDTVRYAKNLETAFETIIQLANDNKPSESFTVIE
ncbi:hypothetical protein GCM10010099_15720 [Streptomyces cinereus]|nr:hypothetical protein GCM10010099_15720 [Streptomyces cinereus]